MKEVLKLKELIAESNKDLEEKRVLLKLKKAKQSVNEVITETEGVILDLEDEVNNLLLADQFDYAEYADKLEELESYKRGLEKAQIFLEQRF